MSHAQHDKEAPRSRDEHAPERQQDTASLNHVAVVATLHCLSGCAIGEVAGMVLGTMLAWHNMTTVVVSILLSFVTGFSLTMLPLLRNGFAFPSAARVAFASDTASITTMEIVDNLLMLVIPGAMTATLSAPRFWWSLALSLALGGVAAFPVNRWLIARGRGHALAHGHH
ncbi:MAG: DUF4396 domain-containing protein [Betaproteobacteria bacterium]|nr:DUF4396 domain-containing protein [Betaproteobacteria bacterium]